MTTAATITSTDELQASLADDIRALHERTRARLGPSDLEHIRNVAAYSRAIKARSRQLLMAGGAPDAVARGSALYALHILLEFAELGHPIMHGAYDELPGADEFRSDVWRWEVLCDPLDWKVMHHQNHHPMTNIVGKDHDLGYSILRALPGQDWFGQHVVQTVLVPGLLASNLYYFAIMPANSAARTLGRPMFAPGNYARAAELIKRHVLRDYVREPVQAGRRFLHTLVGNYAGTAIGHATIMLLVGIEHHAPNVEVFHDPGPDETPDQYFERQIRATSNFTSWARLDDWLTELLADVDHPCPVPMRAFYGALDTHLEHHLFPDLPANRLREMQDDVRDIVTRHALPYNTMPIEKMLPQTLANLGLMSAPFGEREYPRLWRLAAKPIDLTRRLAHGLTFSTNPDSPYLAATKWFDASAKVVASRAVAGGQARTFTIARPTGWDDIAWDPGAFISLRVRVGDETLVRQYSLVNDSRGADHFEICVKRVADGRVSNRLGDALRTGKRVTIVGPPANNGPFIFAQVPEKALFVAGGVGITPIISMIRKIEREAPDTDAVLLYYNRDEKSVIFGRELRRIARHTSLRIEFRTGPMRPDDLASVPDLADRHVYTCAPGPMIELIRSACTSLGVPDEKFHTESFVAVPLERPTEGIDQQFTVRFRRSGVTAQVNGATTLLEAAREHGIDVPTGCEQGLCRACVCPKLSGYTQHDEGLPALARVTVCNSLPRSDIERDI